MEEGTNVLEFNLEDVVVAFLNDRIAGILQELHQFLAQLESTLVLDTDVEQVDFEAITQYLEDK